MQLLYFADPLCSWCYGFGPELAKLLALNPHARVDLVMGGLRAFNRETASIAFREMLRGHWAHVAQASGLPFDPSVLEREGFIYDTEPPCRAVVTARQLDPGRAFALFKALQAAFYRDGRDVTQSGVLADVAAETGFERAAFLAAIESEPMRAATREDFATTQSMGVGGFPTLALARGPQAYLVTSGFVTSDVLQSRLEEIERLAPRPQ